MSENAASPRSALALDAFTRRRFLRSSAFAAGGFAFAGALGPVANALPSEMRLPALAAHRRDALQAVIEALDPVVTDVNAARAPEIVHAVANRYEKETPEMRRNIDIVLDVLDGDSERGAFIRLSKQDRITVLRDGVTGRDQHGESRDNQLPPRADLFEAAVGLATAPFLTSAPQAAAR
jgi:hypothetical protein